MKMKREKTGERKGGGSLEPGSAVGEKGKKGQIEKILASECPRRLPLGSLADFFILFPLMRSLDPG